MIFRRATQLLAGKESKVIILKMEYLSALLHAGIIMGLSDAIIQLDDLTMPVVPDLFDGCSCCDAANCT